MPSRRPHNRKSPVPRSASSSVAYGPPIGSGYEGRVYPLRNNPRLVHKVFDLEFAQRNYAMGGKLRWISRSAYSPVEVTAKDTQPPRKRFNTIPADQWEKLTLILATHSRFVVKKAKSLGIPVPRVIRPVCVKGNSGHFWAVEMSNLGRKGTIVFSANELDVLSKRIVIENLSWVKGQLENDRERLAALGFHEHRHAAFAGWFIRYNPKTRLAERFLVDGTNFSYNPG